MKPLTKKQQELLDYIVAFIPEHQRSPSVREMMRAFGLASPAPIQARLQRLEKAGAITWTGSNTARSLQIVGKTLKWEDAA